MGDINSYALSIDMTLQSNAEEVLQGVTDQISNIENKVKNLIDNMARSMDIVSSGIKISSKDMSNSIRNIDDAIKRTDMGKPATELAEAVNDVSDASSSLTNRSKDLDAAISKVSETAASVGSDISDASNKFSMTNEMFDKIKKSMILVSDVDFMVDEKKYVDEAAESYDFLTNDVLPKLMKQKKELEASGKTQGDTEKSFIKSIYDLRGSMFSKQRNAEKTYQRLRAKWMAQGGKDFEEEIASRFDIIGMTKEQREQYEKMTEAMKVRVRIQGTLEPGDKANSGQDNVSNAEGAIGSAKKLAAVKEAFNGLLSVVKKVTGAMGGMFKTIGYGQMVEAASVTGLYGAAVGKAAEEEEKFHTINFRGIGTMRGMQATIVDLSSKYQGLRSEFIESTIALREVGGTEEDIAKLVPTITALNWITGASTESLSKFAKSQVVVSGSTAKANKEMLMFKRGAKELNLSGKDMSLILSKAADSAFIMGAKGEVYADRYNKALLRAAGAAKNIGVETSEAVGYIDKLQDPLGYVEILGKRVLNMSPSEKMMALGQEAENMFDQLKNAPTQLESNMLKLKFAELLGKPAAKVEQELRLMMETAEKGEDAFKEGLVNPQKEVKDALNDASGLQRQTAIAMEKTMNKLHKTMEPVVNFMTALNKRIAESPMLTTLMAWGTMAGAAGSALFSVLGVVGDIFMAVFAYKGLSGAFGPLTKGSGILKTAFGAIKSTKIGAFFSKMLGPVTKLATKLLPMMSAGLMSAGKALLSFALNPLTLAVTAGAAVSYYAWETARDTIRAEESVSKTNIARHNATKNLENQGKLLRDQLEIEIKMLMTKKAKMIAENKGKPATKAIRSLEKDIHAMQLKQGTRLNNNLGIMKEREKILNRAMKSGTKEEAIQAALSLEAVKQDKSVKDLAKDKELTKKITEKTAKAYKDQQFWIKSAIDEKKKGMKADIDKEKMAVKSVKTLQLSKQKAAEYLAIINQHKEGTVEHGEALRKVAGEIGTGLTDTESKLGDVLKSANKPKKDQVSEADLAEKKKQMAQEIADAPNKEIAAMAKLKAAEVLGIPMDELNDKLSATKKPVVKPETIVTAKIDERTARPPEPTEDKRAVEATKHRTILEEVSRKMDGKNNMDEIITLLKEYLPRMSEKDRGLASSANQWT